MTHVQGPMKHKLGERFYTGSAEVFADGHTGPPARTNCHLISDKYAEADDSPSQSF